MFINHYGIAADYPDKVDRPVFVMGLGLINENWEIPFHRHFKSQLIFANSGVVTLETPDSIWNVPFQGAVWIPSNLTHRAKISGNAKGFVVFVEPDAIDGLPQSCCTIAISPLIRELLQRTATLPELYDENSSEGRLMTVLLDEISTAPSASMNLPMPKNPRLRKMAEAMLDDPAKKLTLDEWAHSINMSERNLSRVFANETGLSVNRWRRQMHVIKAMSMLAEDMPIQLISDALGYENSSAFITMFRKAVGVTPKRFIIEHNELSRSNPLYVPTGSFYEY